MVSKREKTQHAGIQLQDFRIYDISVVCYTYYSSTSLTQLQVVMKPLALPIYVTLAKLQASCSIDSILPSYLIHHPSTFYQLKTALMPVLPHCYTKVLPHKQAPLLFICSPPYGSTSCRCRFCNRPQQAITPSKNSKPFLLLALYPVCIFNCRIHFFP